MRKIGTLSQPRDARRFCDYLLTRQIDATWEQESDGCDVWIRDESDVEAARTELGTFRQDPGAPRYDVGDQVKKIRSEQAKQQQRMQKNIRSVPTGGPGMGRMRQANIPLTIGIIAISVLASFGTNFGNVDWADPRNADFRENLSLETKTYLAMSFVDRYDYATLQSERGEVVDWTVFATADGGDSLASLKKGQVWRLITPMFLHGSVIHLLFNMLWIYTLGSSLERLHGSLFFAGLVLVSQIAGMLVQVLLPDWLPPSLQGSPFAIGASGAVFGLFGYIWIRPKVEALYPIRMPPQNVMLMLGWLVICMTPLIGNVANGAHLGGLLGGVAAAYLWPGRVT
ncbi:rhomboid family intramembrane serine protease [Crateriforma conspicua]|uniref:rhomboid family intramembrane serine protease n=1 Tax=Crateriforma conspicua TaxID=2527996 RepID=UPI00118A7DDF|nr:rhomboid family intramembrane serine protease [Crateriforma conspicua]QDV61614.1 Rhomboid protease GlpG [Crateriforma conspicua]